MQEPVTRRVKIAEQRVSNWIVHITSQANTLGTRWNSQIFGNDLWCGQRGEDPAAEHGADFLATHVPAKLSLPYGPARRLLVRTTGRGSGV